MQNMEKIANLSNREYLLFQKYYGLERFSGRVSNQELDDFKSNLMTYDDVVSFMNNKKNDIEIRFCQSDEDKKLWLIGKHYVSTLDWTRNPGRCQLYIVLINGKYAGYLSLASDIIVLNGRDDYIGWTKEDKLFSKRLNNTAIASTIVPTQPLGFNTCGGKLLSLLLYHRVFRDNWESQYNDILTGISTTSLFGNKNSQYNGMPKYWKNLGETSGKTVIYPQINIYEDLRAWCRETYPEEYDDLTNVRINKKTGRPYKKSSPKNQILNMFYRKTDFKKLWKERNNNRSLNVEFTRGIYFAKFYDETCEFLRGEVTSQELTDRDLDFDIYDSNSIVDYWKRKWGTKRFKKTEPGEVYTIQHSDTVEGFIKSNL
jgi:hypothetical protein